jgi:alpha-beta hydrolase superfamily lysophospholipase
VDAVPVPPAGASAWLRAPDGVRLHTLSWPVDAPRAVVLVSHGLGEHAGRYAALARDLGARGFAVHALDHRGHGLSGGARAYTPRFGRFVDDLEALRLSVSRDTPARVPTFLLGHSLGGLIAIRHLEAHPEAPLAGAILSAPLLGIRAEAPKWKLALAGPLSILLPALPMASELDPALLTADPAYIRSYREDPLVHSKVTPRLYTEMLKAMDDAVAEKGRIALPLLFVVPGADGIVQEEAALRFAESLPGEVTVRRYPGFRHEALNEVERERPVGDVVAWIERHLAAAASHDPSAETAARG